MLQGMINRLERDAVRLKEWLDENQDKIDDPESEYWQTIDDYAEVMRTLRTLKGEEETGEL